MAWSPDGKRIVFKGTNAEGKQEVGIVDARGEKFGFVRRFEGDVLASFAWSPDNSRILFVKQDQESQRYQLFFVEPDTKAAPQLLPAQDDLRDFSDITFSPDGKKIVFSCHKRVSIE
jgi:Tol biopolymer transport system component